MIEVQSFYNHLQQLGLEFFVGVPDSLLKDICAYINDTTDSKDHVICANEGGAIGMAIGYHLATSKVPVIYLQNSGFGNIINPILSLADKDVYGIPMVILMGWRGEPGKKDEPQHITQGAACIPLFESLKMPYVVLSDTEDDIEKELESITQQAVEGNQPVAVLISKGTFSTYKSGINSESAFELSRENAIKAIVDNTSDQDILIGTTGKISRELYEYRNEKGQGHHQDFLTIGGMGHASQIACGIAMQKPHRRVICLDGDGAVIMHMGALPIIGSLKLKNFVHIVLNNAAHDSVGGQPTVGAEMDFLKLGQSSGYDDVFSVESKNQIDAILNELEFKKGSFLIEVKIKKGARKDLGRPSLSPLDRKVLFVDHLKDTH